MNSDYDNQIERLLLLVEKNSVLYDKKNSDYKNDKKKIDIWQAIGKQVGLEYPMVKTKFESIRDSFKKWKDSHIVKSGQEFKAKKKYKWADHLGFLQVHISHRESFSNITKHTDIPVSTDFEGPIAEAPVAEAPVAEAPVAEAPVAEAPVAEAPVAKAPVAKAPVAKAPVAKAPVAKAPVAKAPVAKASADAKATLKSSCNKRKKEEEIAEHLVEYFQSKKARDEQKEADDLTLFFRSHLATVRRFPKLKQIKVKRKMNELILEIEEEIAINEE
ncbi:uncharacterized protein [Antedon mediterranea]|uniref:uncharacterized protein isoform X2 n=1 Tax=Antedon mediterranea TaxID=105859 RepID=UPI003AF43182